MFKQAVALLRGTAHERSAAALAPHGVTILRQQIRDCAATVATARRAIAVAMAQNNQEVEQRDRILTSIADLEDRTMAALEQGKTGLARDAAATIAHLEAERDACDAAQLRFGAEIERLKGFVHSAETRLRELQRGERVAAATHATQKIRAAYPGASGHSTLRDAEATLTQLRRRQAEIDATSDAIEAMELSDDPGAVANRLAAAGCGAPVKTTADDVLARLAQRLQPAA